MPCACARGAFKPSEISVLAYALPVGHLSDLSENIKRPVYFCVAEMHRGEKKILDTNLSSHVNLNGHAIGLRSHSTHMHPYTDLQLTVMSQRPCCLQHIWVNNPLLGPSYLVSKSSHLIQAP